MHRGQIYPIESREKEIYIYPCGGKLDLSVCGRLASGDAVCGGVKDVIDDKDDRTSLTGATPRDDSISSKSLRLSRLEAVLALC